jgi:hypothetical protein
LATKSTCFCATAQHAHAHELLFGLQSLVERGVPPHSLGHFIFRHSRPLRTRTENATVLNRVAMRAGKRSTTVYKGNFKNSDLHSSERRMHMTAALSLWMIVFGSRKYRPWRIYKNRVLTPFRSRGRVAVRRGLFW